MLGMKLQALPSSLKCLTRHIFRCLNGSTVNFSLLITRLRCRDWIISELKNKPHQSELRPLLWSIPGCCYHNWYTLAAECWPLYFDFLDEARKLFFFFWKPETLSTLSQWKVCIGEATTTALTSWRSNATSRKHSYCCLPLGLAAEFPTRKRQISFVDISPPLVLFPCLAPCSSFGFIQEWHLHFGLRMLARL